MGNESRPVISVIVPSYNHERYIIDTLNSIFSQDIPRSAYEVIVVDDGSTDNSVDLLKKMQLSLPFVLLTQLNSGVSTALNYGVKISTGTYIAISASDDIWEPNKLRLQLNELKAKPESRFCYTNGSVFGVISKERYKPFLFTGDVRKIVSVVNFVPSSSIMFHRSLFDEIGGFSKNIALEDWDFIIRAASVTQFSCVDKPLIRYRTHQLNTMKQLRASRSILSKKYEVLHKNRSIIGRHTLWFSMIFHCAYEKIGQSFAWISSIKGS